MINLFEMIIIIITTRQILLCLAGPQFWCVGECTESQNVNGIDPLISVCPGSGGQPYVIMTHLLAIS